MSRREIELVTALAEGSLVDETEARALIEKSPRLRRVYEEQLLAFQALSSLPADPLTDTEKAALRRDVWTAYTTTPAKPEKAPSSRWGWSYAAVFVFALVGLVAVLNGSGADSLNTSGFPESDAVAGSEDQPPPGVTTTASARQAQDELFSNWAESARAGREIYRDASTLRAEDLGVFPTAGSCLDDPPVNEDPGRAEVIDLVEQDGSRFAIWMIRAEEPGSEPDVVIVDLDRCEIAYRD